MVSSTPRTHFTPGKDPVPTLQEAGWVPGPVWTGGKSLPHRDSIPYRPARSQSLYRLSYPAHFYRLLVGYKSKRMRWIIYVSLTEQIRNAYKYRSKQFREGDMSILVSNIKNTLKNVGYVDVV